MPPGGGRAALRLPGECACRSSLGLEEVQPSCAKHDSTSITFIPAAAGPEAGSLADTGRGMITLRIDGQETPLDDPQTVTSRAAGCLVWADALSPSEHELAWLQSAFHLHPLEMDDIRGRNERPKVDDFGDHLFVVLIAAVRQDPDAQLNLTEMHIVVAPGRIVTIRDRSLPAVEALANRCRERPELAQGDAGTLFYRLCDAAVDSYFPLLDQLDEDIDHLETSIIEHADSGTVSDIFSLKRDLNILRRVLGPLRDLMQALAGPHGPQLGDEAKLYLRDVYDHAVRITEQVDAYRDTVTGALDVYLSSVSNKLSEQTRRLAVVATIFLPLTFLTGFFGMNFSLLVAFIAHDWVFWAVLVLMALSVPSGYWLSHTLSASARPLPETRTRRRPRFTQPRRRHAASATDTDLEVVPARLATRTRSGPA